MDVEQHTLRRGARITTVSFGPPDGRAAVVLAGLDDGLDPLSGRDPSDVPPPSSPFSDLRVHVLGYSDDVGHEATTGELADDVAEVVGQLAPAGAIVSGHSLGAFVAVQLAARHPTLVHGLLLTGAPARPDEPFRRALGYWADLAVQGLRPELEGAMSDAAYTGWERRKRSVTRLVARGGGAPDGWAERFERLVTVAIEHEAPNLTAITVPAHVVAGAKDDVARPEAVRELANLLGNARFTEVADGAHGFPEQFPDAVTEAALALLAAVDAAQPSNG